MGQALAIRRYSPAEYYQQERPATFKSEYIHGEIVAMAGGTTKHSLIKTNLLGELRNLLKGCPCAPYDSDQRLRVKATGLRTYPDAAVYCGPMEYDPEDNQAETATNPTALFEVLSDSTEAYDRGAKAAHYRRIESLKAYVLVSPHVPLVELFELAVDGVWQMREASGLEATLNIASLGIELRLAELYDRVVFDEPLDGRFALRVIK